MTPPVTVHTSSCSEGNHDSPLILFGLESGERNEPMTKYVSKMKNRLRKAYETTKASGQSQDKQKANYDVRVRRGRVEIGDRVLVRRLAFDGKHK